MGLGERGGEVADGEEHEADVDEVGAGGPVQPVELEVVDFEGQVRRHPFRLHGRDVGADHGGPRVLVRHLHGPDAGAGADVEDLLRGGGEGREVQAAGGEEHHFVVFHVFAVEFGLGGRGLLGKEGLRNVRDEGVVGGMERRGGDGPDYLVVGEEIAASAVGVISATIVPVVVFGFAEDAAEEARAGWLLG